MFTKIAEHIPRVQGWGPSGTWDMQYRSELLGPIGSWLSEEESRRRQYYLNLEQSRRARNWVGLE